MHIKLREVRLGSLIQVMQGMVSVWGESER